MPHRSDRYYHSAGAVPLMGPLLMTGVGVAAAAVCGGLYTLADLYLHYRAWPSIYGLIAGAGIGMAVRVGGRAGRVRHRGYLGFVGLLMGMLGAYFSWVVFIRLWRRGAVGGVWLWDPQLLFWEIAAISEIGVWKDQLPGLWLKSLYVAESLWISAIACLVASLPSDPYCERCRQWTKGIPETATLKATDPDALRGRLENSEYEALDELLDPLTDEEDCLHVHVYVCPTCNESNYLAVSHFTRTQTLHRTRERSDWFIRFLWVPAEVVEQVRRLAAACR